MIGGAMVGPQNTSIKAQLGPLLNGWTNYEFWLPVPKMDFPGVNDMLAKYQKRAPAEGIDPYGYYMAPPAYAQYQVLEQAVEATKSLNDQALADYIRKTTFKTGVRRHPLRQGRRVGGVARAAGAVPRHQGQRSGAVQGHRHPAGGRSCRLCVGELIYPYEKAQSLGPTPGSNERRADNRVALSFMRYARTACDCALRQACASGNR